MTTTTHTTDRPAAPTTAAPTVQEQAAAIVLPQAAGYVGHRTITIGLRQGLLEELAASAPLTAEELADARGFDPFYTAVWCRAALASGVLERHDGRYRLAQHMDTLLLDEASPVYAGAQFTLLERPEVFDRFEDNLESGDRAWWDDASPQFIENVGRTGKPFYTRLVPGGLRQIDGLEERLAEDCQILDTACGAGNGLIRLARSYPTATVVGPTATPTRWRSLAGGPTRPASATGSTSSTPRSRSSTSRRSSRW